MTQMCITGTATNFCLHHTKSSIFNFGDICFFQLIRKCRPSTPAFKLLLRGKKRNIADNAIIDPWLEGVTILVSDNPRIYLCKAPQSRSTV